MKNTQLKLTMPWTALALSSMACGAPYSNENIEEDVLFEAALPQLQHVQMGNQPATSLKLLEDDESCLAGDMQRITFRTMNEINNLTAEVIDGIQDISSNPISFRAPDLRQWGPYEQIEDGQSLFWTLNIERRETRQADELVTLYYYWLNGSFNINERGISVVYGSWNPDYDIERGIGTFVYDFDALARLEQESNPRNTGAMTITYNTLSKRQVWAEVNGSYSSVDGTLEALSCEFTSDGRNGGWFSFNEWSNIVPETEVLEHLQITSRWLVDGSGRSEGLYADGDLDMLTIGLTECWDETACNVYYQDTLNYQDPMGSPNLCTIEDVIIPQ